MVKNLFKHFIGYNDDDVIRPLCIKLPQTVKHFDSNKIMSFKVTDNKLLKKYTKIWGRINNLIGKYFSSEPVYGDNEKYIKTKIKSYGDKRQIFKARKYQKKMHHTSACNQ